MFSLKADDETLSLKTHTDVIDSFRPSIQYCVNQSLNRSLGTFKEALCKEVSTEIRSVVRNEMKTLVPILCNDLQTDLRFNLSDSITSNVSRNLCSSLRTHLVHCMEEYDRNKPPTVAKAPHVKSSFSLYRNDESSSSRTKKARNRPYNLDDQSPSKKKVKVCKSIDTKKQSMAVKYIFSKTGKVRFMCFKVNENKKGHLYYSFHVIQLIFIILKRFYRIILNAITIVK